MMNDDDNDCSDDDDDHDDDDDSNNSDDYDDNDCSDDDDNYDYELMKVLLMITLCWCYLYYVEIPRLWVESNWCREITNCETNR